MVVLGSYIYSTYDCSNISDCFDYFMREKMLQEEARLEESLLNDAIEKVEIKG